MPRPPFNLQVPADVPLSAEGMYRDNFNALTHSTGYLMLYACDQKIEHLNDDFYGKNIPEEALNPEHLFAIAQKGRIGAMAAHPGLIMRYAKKYDDILYVAKINAKTNLIETEQQDPVSTTLLDVQQIITLREESKIPIAGIGVTIYLGSTAESEMLHAAAQAIYQAHQYGLVAILWVYPRGKAIDDDQEPQLVAGATGLANALGADFVKVKAPHATDTHSSAENLAIAAMAAGSTGIICSGGKHTNADAFLHELYEQLTIGNSRGSATGRNIFQRPLEQAIAMTRAISALVIDGADLKTALHELDTAE